MKLELPLAIVLLAIGGWLWIQHFPTMEFAESTPAPAVAHSLESGDSTNEVADSEESAGSYGLEDSSELLPDYGQLKKASYGQPVNRMVVGPTFEPTEDDPGMVLAKSAKQLQMSPPIACKVRSRIYLFEQEITGNGRYFQQGQGRGRTRLEMNFPLEEDAKFESVQICDGKFHYWIQSIAGERQIEFVDLSELKSQKFDLSQGPSQWLNRAGIVSLLKNLSAAFEFDPPQPTQLGGIDMLRITGRWKPEAIQSVLYGQVDPRNGNQQVEWQRLPAQIPHAVELYLGADGFLPLFPYQMTFFRYEDSNDQSTKTPLMVMELYEVQKVDEVPESLFRVNADNSRQIDLSQSYSDRLEYMAESAAAAQTPTQNR